MITRNLLVLLFTAFSLVWANPRTSRDIGGNLTVTFFPGSQGDSCRANDISKAITLTTMSRPEAYTCFNMSDIFSQKSSTGFQVTIDQQFSDRGGGLNGVSWALHNQDLYDPNVNYSHTWLKMLSISGAQVDKRSVWNFYQYTLPDCLDVRIGVEDTNNVPFSWTSCQTSENGRCKSTGGYPIGSFAILSPGWLHDDKAACDKWEQYGAAAAARADVGCLVMAVVMSTCMLAVL